MMMNAVQAGAPRPVAGQHMLPFVKQMGISPLVWCKGFIASFSVQKTRGEQVDTIARRNGYRQQRMSDRLMNDIMPTGMK